jgi:hypothetical protein
VSNLFICVAVLVDDATRLETETSIRALSQAKCSGAEISSKRIGGANEKRLEFLSQVANLPFGYYALIINKDRLPPDSGFRIKRSFYKCINRMLYERLITTGKNLRVIADQIGGADFMASFDPYLEEKGIPGLFQNFAHAFANSADEPLIQLADLIAGSLSYCFDPQKQNAYSTRFRELLRPREIRIQSWPLESPSTLNENDRVFTDEIQICTSMTNRVTRFLDIHENSPDMDHRMQAQTLSYLLFARQFEDRANQAVMADVIMTRLRMTGFEQISKQAFQSRVIGRIRDEGIILAGSFDGYRLALSLGDIHEYLDHDGSIIEPMLARLLKAKESVSLDTAGQLDIFGERKFSCLKRLSEVFSDLRASESAARRSI